jgi:hypothetical protein
VLLKCIANRGSALGPSRSGSLVTEETRLDDLTVGRQYRSYAMAIYLGCLNVLVCDDYDYPVWLPIGLFVVEEPRLACDWEFASFRDEDPGTPGKRGLQAIWGYPEIVRSDAHYEGLIEGDPDARRVFLAVRRLADGLAPV